MSTTPYEQGRSVATGLTAHVCNPYPPLSDDWFEWRKGFLDRLLLSCAEMEAKLNPMLARAKAEGK